MTSSKMHYFKVNNLPCTSFLELTYVTSHSPLKGKVLGCYPYVSYVKEAALKYFINEFKESKFDQYAILWPKTMSYVTKDEEV